MRGLQGRRIAVVSGAESEADRSAPIARALSDAGAEVESLGSASASDSWQSARYAALVLSGTGSDPAVEPRVVQLVREFLLANKPLVVAGDALELLERAEGASGRRIAAPAKLRDAMDRAGATVTGSGFEVDDALITVALDGNEPAAPRIVQALTTLLEEHDVDEASDLSFPASDPPAVSPGTATPKRNESRAGG